MNTAQHRLQIAFELLKIAIETKNYQQMDSYRRQIIADIQGEDLHVPLVALLAAVSEIDEEDLHPNVREALRAFQKTG